MMGKITRNRDVTIIDRLTADSLEARKKLNLPVGLGVLFIAGEQGACAERDAQNAIGECTVV